MTRWIDTACPVEGVYAIIFTVTRIELRADETAGSRKRYRSMLEYQVTTPLMAISGVTYWKPPDPRYFVCGFRAVLNTEFGSYVSEFFGLTQLITAQCTSEESAVQDYVSARKDRHDE